MKHILLVIACVVLCLGLRFAPSGQAQAQAAPVTQRERWEYANLSFLRSRDTQFIWSRAAHKGNDAVEAAIASKREKPTIPVLLDVAGDDGWELVAAQTEKDELIYTTFYFKRPKG